MTLNYRIIAPNATPDPTSLVWINTVMTSIKQSAGLTDNDVEGGDYLVTVDNLKGYYDSLSKNSNRTQIGLLFCAAGQETFALDTFCQGKA